MQKDTLEHLKPRETPDPYRFAHSHSHFSNNSGQSVESHPDALTMVASRPTRQQRRAQNRAAAKGKIKASTPQPPPPKYNFFDTPQGIALAKKFQKMSRADQARALRQLEANGIDTARLRFK